MCIRDSFEVISRNRMNDLDNLPDYCLWSRDFKFDEVASLLKFLCKNFNEDIEILRYKIKTGRIKKVCNGVVTWDTVLEKDILSVSLSYAQEKNIFICIGVRAIFCQGGR